MAKACRRVARGLRHRYVAGYCISCGRKKPGPSRLVIPRKALDQVEEEAKERGGPFSNTNFAYVTERGKVEVVLGNACFGSLLFNPLDHASFKWFIFFRGLRNPAGEEATHAYLNWLCTESYWADAFEAGPRTLREQGAIFDATKWSALWIIFACQLVRMAHEYPKMIECWYKFQKHIDPHAALLFAHSAAARYNAQVTDEYYVTGSSWGAQHTALHSDYGGKKALKRLLEGDFQKSSTEVVMNESLDFRGSHQLFQVEGERNFLLKFPDPTIVRVPHEYYQNRPTQVKAHLWANLEQDLRMFMEVNT